MMRHQGIISHWQDDRGFGFISPTSGTKDVFVHIHAFDHRHRRPQLNDPVTYLLKTDEKGRARAEQVTYIGKGAATTPTPWSNFFALTLATAALTFVTGASLIGKLPLLAPIIYCAASVLTFLVYGFDKSAAQGDRWRTPENTLHFMALAGGWPGALAAQRMLRHKAKKLSFQIVFWMTVVINCGLLGWSTIGAGGHTLAAMIESAKLLMH